MVFIFFHQKNTLGETQKLDIESRNAKLENQIQARGSKDWPIGINQIDKSVVLVIDPNIVAGIRDSLSQFKADLHLDGYNVIEHILMESTPSELRSYLYDIYQTSTPQLVGAILIGNIPKPYFRYHYPASSGCLERGPYECISFQFYQDLDGVFSCSNPGGCFHPGCYDTHSGSIDSEIWVSVLPHYFNWITTINSINSYFTKNHRFRTGLMRSSPGYIRPLIGSRINTPELYSHQVDIIINGASAWKPLTNRGNILVGPDNSLEDITNYPNAAYCYNQAMLTNQYDFADIGAHGSCTRFSAPGGSIYIDVNWANTNDIKSHYLWDGSCNTGNIDCHPNLLTAFLYHPYNYVVLVKGATSEAGGLGGTTNGDYRPYIGGLLAQEWSFGEAIISHMNSQFVDCYAQQREYFVAQHILLGDGTLKLPEHLPQMTCPDPNHDGIVNIFDLSMVAVAFGSIAGDNNWNPSVDCNNDGEIDIFDLVAIASHFGEIL